MRCNTNVALVSLGLLLGTAGCDTFLTGDKLSNNPNLPTAASIQQLFVGVQAGQFAFQEGTVAMMMCMWVQACSAANGRFVQQAGQYVFGEGSNIGANGGDWISAYAGGGLVDIKQVEADATTSGDDVWLGIAKIWEAFTVGTISDMWGDVPYSEAVSGKKDPVLDQRFAILANLQTVLDQAIVELGGSGAGPGDADLVFGGDPAKWTKVAWTLKARYYMHTAESLSTSYTAALAAAANGISDASGDGDFASFHTSATSERNMWAQFQTSSGFGTDLEAGKYLVDIMNARRDPRRDQYFCKFVTAAWLSSHKYILGQRILDPNNNVQGVQALTLDSLTAAAQPAWNTTVGGLTTDNHVTWVNQGPPYGGDDFNVPPPAGTVSSFSCLPPRFSATTRIPYVSYVENELILAEATSATGGSDAVALTHLNNARAFANAKFASPPPVGSTALPTLVGITGAALFDSIMVEKYVSLFQNMESISDYRRTCIPDITPSHNTQSFTKVPGRLYYPQNERNVNPNIPDPSVQLATHGFRNQGDLDNCTRTAP